MTATSSPYFSMTFPISQTYSSLSAIIDLSRTAKKFSFSACLSLIALIRSCMLPPLIQYCSSADPPMNSLADAKYSTRTSTVMILLIIYQKALIIIQNKTMKALQNFLVRTKAFLAKEQSRQLEFFQKKMQNQHQHGGLPGSQIVQNPPNASVSLRALFFNRQRQLFMHLRPFQRFLSTTVIMQSMKHSYYIKLQLMMEDEDHHRVKLALKESQESSMAWSEYNLPEQNMEGILEILTSPPKGVKEFCGKIIDLNFQHVIETMFPDVVVNCSGGLNNKNQCDTESLAQSQYFFDDEYPLVAGENVNRIIQGENLLNLSVCKSELEYLIVEGGYASSEEVGSSGAPQLVLQY